MNVNQTPRELQELMDQARNRDGDACYNLAELYYQKEDYEKAVFWYQEAASCKKVNPNVYFNLGFAYQHGEGVPKDMIAALDYYQKAAEFGVPQALYNLAYFYQNGLGVTQDFDKAAYYIRRASEEMSQIENQLYCLHMENEKLQKAQIEMMQTIKEKQRKCRETEEEKNAAYREMSRKEGQFREETAVLQAKLRELRDSQKAFERLLAEKDRYLDAVIKESEEKSREWAQRMQEQTQRIQQQAEKNGNLSLHIDLVRKKNQKLNSVVKEQEEQIMALKRQKPFLPKKYVLGCMDIVAFLLSAGIVYVGAMTLLYTGLGNSYIWLAEGILLAAALVSLVFEKYYLHGGIGVLAGIVTLGIIVFFVSKSLWLLGIGCVFPWLLSGAFSFLEEVYLDKGRD